MLAQHKQIFKNISPRKAQASEAIKEMVV